MNRNKSDSSVAKTFLQITDPKKIRYIKLIQKISFSILTIDSLKPKGNIAVDCWKIKTWHKNRCKSLIIGNWQIEFHPQRLYLKYKMTKTFHFKLGEVIKKRISYGQADRKGWPPPYSQVFCDFSEGCIWLWFILIYDYTCVETTFDKK